MGAEGNGCSRSTGSGLGYLPAPLGRTLGDGAERSSPSAAGASPGLVYSSTSHPLKAGFLVNPSKSRHRRIRAGIICAARGVVDHLHGVRYQSFMVTLTYRPGVVPEARHISAALNGVKQWAERQGSFCHWVWRLEYGEQRGRPHYHVLVWLRRGLWMPNWDNRGWWSHGMTKTERARKPVHYMAKYASKRSVFLGETDFDTRGMRWWGCRAPALVRALVRLKLAPHWVQDKAELIGGTIQRLAFGWWRIGAWEFRSPWEFVGFDPGGVRVRWRGWDEWEFALC